MRVCTFAAAVVVSATLAFGQTAKAQGVDISKAAVEKKTVKKELIIVKPKTNWSRIKDLFM